MLLEHVQRAQVFDQAVAQGAVELKVVTVRAHAAVADQVARVLHREQVLPGDAALLEISKLHARGFARVLDWIEPVSQMMPPSIKGEI